MARSRSSPGLAAARALVALTAAVAAAQTARPLARLSVVDRSAELRTKGRDWEHAVEGAPVAIGSGVRVGPDAVARLELPWMALTLSSGARLHFADERLLSAVLEDGRALVEAEAHDALTLVTAEAELRGRGRAIVRRRARTTLVTCLSGRFRLSSAGGALALGPGEAGFAVARRPPTPGRPPAAPARLWPGRDPVYVAAGQPLELRWEGRAPAYQVELLPVGTEVVLMQRDVGAAGLRIEVPWPGAFRWRVSARDEHGIEGPPSEEGLIAVE